MTGRESSSHVVLTSLRGLLTGLLPLRYAQGRKDAGEDCQVQPAFVFSTCFVGQINSAVFCDDGL